MALAEEIAVSKTAPALVIGLGRTGLSVARFLGRRGAPFAVADSRSEPPGLEVLRQEFPEAEVFLGPFDSGLFSAAGQVILSPGVPPDQPAVSAAREAGVPVLGDIELFAGHAASPVIAITGSNGKSTVTSLVGEMAREAGLEVAVGGNIGTPALELLSDPPPELYVLELSSFQLEQTWSLNAAVGVVLNVSDDHLDRHASLNEYSEIKRRVYRGNGQMVLNADDALVAAMAEPGRPITRFGLRHPKRGDFGLIRQGDEVFLARGDVPWISTREIPLVGRQNHANVLAAFAVGAAFGLDREAMQGAVRKFGGLPHRCQFVGSKAGVAWYNDSKGTNVGAATAALRGIPGEKIVLIAGGEGKGADFAPLKMPVAERARAVVLIGRDAPEIERALGGAVPICGADSMESAVAEAARLARAGDSVLLSPACASFDMFTDYAARGDAFVAAVGRLSE